MTEKMKKLHLWDAEWRMVDSPSIVSSQVMLMDGMS
jgi:hypothetical protein